MAMSRAVFETYKGEDGQYYGRFKARNGEIVWQTEGHPKPFGVDEAIVSLVTAIHTDQYEIVTPGLPPVENIIANPDLGPNEERYYE